MNITTTKHLPLLLSFTLLAACSTQNTSGTGGQSSLAGQQSAPESSRYTSGGQQSGPGSQNSAGRQSIPGSQLIGQQNKKPTTVAGAKKIEQKPKVAASSSSMRKIVLKAPAKTIKPIVVAKPSTNKPRTTTSAPMTPRETYNKVMANRATAAQPSRVTRPAAIRPSGFVNRPPVTQPYKTPTIANPVRSAPVRQARPVLPVPVARPTLRPVAKPAAPASTLRRLTLNGSANFKSGSSRLTARGQTKLLGLSLNLQEGTTQVSRLLIEGHTDSTGNAAMNQVLSLKRANAVAEYLASKGGFTRSMMETVGLGESKPVASNKTRKGRALNRRVEITATGTRRISP